MGRAEVGRVEILLKSISQKKNVYKRFKFSATKVSFMPFITYIFYYFSTYGIGTSNMTQQKFVLVRNSKYKNCMYYLSSVLCMNQRKLFYTPILERRRGAIKNK